MPKYAPYQVVIDCRTMRLGEPCWHVTLHGVHTTHFRMRRLKLRAPLLQDCHELVGPVGAGSRRRGNPYRVKAGYACGHHMHA
eukprot:362989-Chlamydomonas_euryale.AAC.9